MVMLINGECSNRDALVLCQNPYTRAIANNVPVGGVSHHFDGCRRDTTAMVQYHSWNVEISCLSVVRNQRVVLDQFNVV